MRRWMYIATFGLLLLSLSSWGQQRGGGGGHAVSGGGGFAAHSSGSVGSFRGGGSSRSENFTHNSGVRIQAGHPNRYPHENRPYPYRRRVFINGRFFYPTGLYPYAGYYPWYSDSFGYQNDYQNNDNEQTADSYDGGGYPGPHREDSGLQSDVRTLSGKIDRLQADVEARNRPKQQEPATALVFRDRHVEEVHNYAIAGGTLWVLNDAAAKKIPLAQLDIPATVKINEDRGVDFQVPGPSLSLRIMN